MISNVEVTMIAGRVLGAISDFVALLPKPKREGQVV